MNPQAAYGWQLENVTINQITSESVFTTWETTLTSTSYSCSIIIPVQSSVANITMESFSYRIMDEGGGGQSYSSQVGCYKDSKLVSSTEDFFKSNLVL